MITLRRADERHHDRRGRRDVWLSFDPHDGADSSSGPFGALEIFSEDRLRPGARMPPYPRHHAEIVTYVHEGALAYDDSVGHSGVIRAGEFQRVTADRAIRRGATNLSRSELAHVFQISLYGSDAPEPGHQQKRFSAAERRGGLCVVASRDARCGSLRLAEDVVLYSALLGRGQHVVHALAPERSAWLHLVEGEVTLGDVVLGAGDGAGVTAERCVSLTARERTEILLLELGAQRPTTTDERLA